MRLVTLALVAISMLAPGLAHPTVPETKPLTVRGPDASTFTLGLSNRLRGEFAD